MLSFLFTSHVYQKVCVRAVCTQTTAWMSLTPTMCHVVPSSLTSRTTSWRWKASRPSSLTARPQPTPRPPTACTKYWSTTPSPSPLTWIQGAPPSTCRALLSFSFSLPLFLCLYTRPSVFICIFASYTNIYLIKSYILVSSTSCHVKSSVLFRVLQFGNTPR